MRNKIFIKTICVILMTALLTFSVGRAYRVSAMGLTIAALAGEALIGVGIGFLSYCALTGMATNCPDGVDACRDWLRGIGEKVVQYPSGKAAYDDVYNMMLNEPVQDALDRAWSWTTDKLLSFANDFSDTRVISDIVAFDTVSSVPLNGFDYTSLDYTFVDVPQFARLQYGTYTFSELINNGYTVEPIHGLRLFYVAYPNCNFFSSTINEDASNFRHLFDGERYTLQHYEVDHWSNYYFSGKVGYVVDSGNDPIYVQPLTDFTGYTSRYGTLNIDATHEYPLLPDVVIYDSVNDEYLPMVVPNNTQLPSWTDPDNDYRPIVPYVQTPFDPNFVPVPNSPFGNVPAWGFNIEDLLDILADIGQGLFELQVLKDLINAFKQSDTTNYYIFYDNGTGDTYVSYYQDNSITDYGDYQVVNYNIDVSDVDEHLPVDLNTISQYTNNPYIDTVKSSAQNGSTILRDFFVFWHDVDAELVYVLFGCAIVTLIGAFIGKWGHS